MHYIKYTIICFFTSKIVGVSFNYLIAGQFALNSLRKKLGYVPKWKQMEFFLFFDANCLGAKISQI